MLDHHHEETRLPDVFDVITGRHEHATAAATRPDANVHCEHCGRSSDVTVTLAGATHCIGCIDVDEWEYAA